MPWSFFMSLPDRKDYRQMHALDYLRVDRKNKHEKATVLHSNLKEKSSDRETYIYIYT